MFPKSTILVFLLILASISLYGQEESRNSNFGISVRSSLSFSGINLGLTVDYVNQNWSTYVGPKVLLSKSASLARGPFGLMLGGAYTLNPEDRWQSSVNLDYQATFYKQDGNPADLIHEGFISYGLRFMATDNIFVSNQLGLGFWMESNYSTTTGKRQSLSGYNGLLNLGVGYLFK